MQLAGELSEGLLDLGLVGARVDAQHLVVVTFGSHASSLEARATEPAAPQACGVSAAQGRRRRWRSRPLRTVTTDESRGRGAARPWPETWPAQPPRQRALGASPESSLPTSCPRGYFPYQRTSCRASAACRYNSAALAASPLLCATSPSATHAPARWLTVSTAAKQSTAALKDASARSSRPSSSDARPITI